METSESPTLKHIDFLPLWGKAMAGGLMGGRPFSKQTIQIYMHYTEWFLERYEHVSVRNLKLALLEIPPEQFAKRQKLVQGLNCLAKLLIEEGVLDSAYLEEAKALKPRRHKPPKRTTVSEEGIESLIAHCDKPMDQVLMILLSYTGLRVSEAARLTTKDIDLENRVLTVRLAKWGKSRRVGISTRLFTALETYLASMPQTEVEKPLFRKQNGKPMDRFGIAIRLRKLCLKSGIPVTPHALRRAFVTINANKGRPLPMLQIACGHSDITTTRSYCMTSEDETITAMQTWD